MLLSEQLRGTPSLPMLVIKFAYVGKFASGRRQLDFCERVGNQFEQIPLHCSPILKVQQVIGCFLTGRAPFRHLCWLSLHSA